LVREYNFDGIVGPTHQYSGLSLGNLASAVHRGKRGDPRAAALQGLAKMRTLAALGVGQAVLPPQPRPCLQTLRRLGFTGSDGQVLDAVFRRAPELLAACSSASSMWAANAASFTPSSDTSDAKAHFTVANLASMFHRSLEAQQTAATLRAIFSDSSAFEVHEALPTGLHFTDEGAANHTRLAEAGSPALHIFGWGRRAFGETTSQALRFPARQTFEASEAVARLNRVKADSVLLWQQEPLGIESGAFHSDVLAVGHEYFFLYHAAAFCDPDAFEAELRRRFQGSLQLRRVTDAELSVTDAVQSYLFNSQLVSLPEGGMAIVVPQEVRQNPSAEALLQRLLGEANPLDQIVEVEVNASMKNGGGPACLRLRVSLTDAESARVNGRVFLDEALGAALEQWIGRHYRDRLELSDLADPRLLEEGRVALHELTRILQIGPIYPFQGGA